MGYIFLICFSTVLAKTVAWAFSYFGLSSFEQLVFHIKVPLEGTNKQFLIDWVKMCFIFGMVVGLVISYLVSLGQLWFIAWIWFVLCLIYSAWAVGLFAYIAHQFMKSSIYEDEYIEVNEASLEAPKKKMNLIHIYLESMETTFAKKEDGGNAKEELLPYLTSLTKENISFSKSSKIGGAKVVVGTGWTTGGLVASSAGLPLNFPLNHPFCSDTNDFMPGCMSLGDILQKDGYSNTLLIGSQAVFGGRKFYYDKHGNYDIYDLDRVKQEGWLDEKYHVFWGYEDKKLFDFAKKKISDLAASDQPFNFEMLTVDTHHPYGYQDETEEAPYREGISNSIYHTDRLLKEFMGWLEKQPFYEDTLVVIQGDHTSMAAQYIHSNYDSSYDRRVWNCFIHSKKEKKRKMVDFTTLDLFPTILSGMGYTLKKNGLALGKDLFSGEETLLEKYGEKELNHQIQCQSSLYKKDILGL